MVHVCGALLRIQPSAALPTARGLLRDELHSATVRATADVSLLALERADFLCAAMGDDDCEQPMLGELERPAVDELARGVGMLSLDPSETLFSEGDEDDRYFVILDGEIEIHAGGQRRRVLAPGDGFGEIAVLYGKARTTSAVARTPVRLVRWPQRSCANGSPTTCRARRRRSAAPADRVERSSGSARRRAA